MMEEKSRLNTPALDAKTSLSCLFTNQCLFFANQEREDLVGLERVLKYEEKIEKMEKKRRLNTPTFDAKSIH